MSFDIVTKTAQIVSIAQFFNRSVFLARFIDRHFFSIQTQACSLNLKITDRKLYQNL